jgi:hypothetical protein
MCLLWRRGLRRQAGALTVFGARLLLDFGGLLVFLVACVAIAVTLVEFVGIP